MKKLLLIIFNLLVIPPVAMYSYYTFSPAKQALDNPPTIDAPASPKVLGATDNPEQIYFTVNIPATFKRDISAPNIVYSVNGETGEIDIDNSLVAGDGIEVSGRTISNTGILTLVAGDGVSIDGNKITNSGILSLEAGTNISIDGNTITNTYTAQTIDYGQSGWTDNGSTITLTTTTDTVTVGGLTFDSATITNGNSFLPDTDLGSDLGSTAKRFNNLWVANINSNSSQSFSGQTTFSYPPTDTTIDEASVLINPTTSAASGQLLGLAIAGYQKAMIDEDGDITLGYSDATSAPASDYPLNIYGHGGTRVSFVDTSGNAYFSGRVGIGTAPYPTDTYQLYVAGGARFNGSNLFLSGADFFATTSGFGGFTGDAKIIAGNNEKVRITTTGNVGIGTTSPGAELEVAGDILVTAYSPSLKLWNTYGTPGYWKIGYGSGSTGHNLQFSTSYAGSTALVIQDQTGNVGIGTTSPSYKLEVSGKIYSNDTLIVNDDGGTNITLQRSGVNKWGLLLPNSDFSIRDLTTLNDIFYIEDGADVDSLRIQANGNVIMNGGNVGIGTTSPTHALTIAPSTNTSVFKVVSSSANTDIYLDNSVGGRFRWNGTGIHNNVLGVQFDVGNFEKMRIDTSGNVGIGTTSPGYKLEIAGKIGIDGTQIIYLPNQTDFSDTLIFGDGGTNLSHTIGSTGQSNLLVGLGAGIGLTTGYENMFIGADAGASVTSGVVNMFLGASSGTAITDQGSNTFIGARSGQTSVTSNSTFIGAQAGKDSSSSYTVMIGSGIGIDSTGSFNLFAGNNAGQLNIAGERNTFLGYSAGEQNLTGNQNVYIGFMAGENATGTGNLFIGYDTGSDETGSNKLYLDNSNTTTPLIWGDFANDILTVNGNIGIGTTSPGAKLHTIGSGNTSSTFSLIADNGDGTDILRIRDDGITQVFGTISSLSAPLILDALSGQYFSVYTGGTEAMRIDNSGNVGIGTTSPSTKLDIESGHILLDYDYGILLGAGGNGIFGASAQIDNVAYGDLRFYVDNNNNGTDSFEVYGNVSRGTGTPLFAIADTGAITVTSLTTGTVYSNAGVLTNTDPSDETLKDNILSLEDGTLDKVLGLRPVSFNWKSTGDGALSFIAQEVNEIFPELVGSNTDGTLGLYTTQFIPVLAKAIQEQQLAIDEISLSATASADLSTYATKSEFISLSDMFNDFKTQLSITITSITGYFDKIFAKEVNTDELKTKKLCIEEGEESICVSKDQLKQMLENLPEPTPTLPVEPEEATDSAEIN